MFTANPQGKGSVVWHALGSAEFWRTAIVQRVDPLVSIILEIGTEVMQVEARGGVLQFVIQRTAEAVAFALISVLPNVHAAIAWDGRVIKARLDIVNAAAVIVVAAGEQRSEALVVSKALAHGAGHHAGVTGIYHLSKP